MTRPARGYVRRQSVVRDERPPDWPSTERPHRIILEPSARKKELAHAARQGASASGHVTVGRIWAAAGSDGALHEAHGGIGQREGRAAQVEPKHCDGAEARSIDGLAGKARAARDGLRRCSGGGWQGRAFRDNVRHRRHGSSGAPALTRSLAVALLKGALEGSLQVLAQRLPYLDGSRLGGGARLAGRSCGVAEQRNAALGLEPIGARGAQPAPGHVFAEGVAPTSRAADEKRLAIVPARSNAAELSARKASLWLKGHGLCISAGSAVLGSGWVLGGLSHRGQPHKPSDSAA